MNGFCLKQGLGGSPTPKLPSSDSPSPGIYCTASDLKLNYNSVFVWILLALKSGCSCVFTLALTVRAFFKFWLATCNLQPATCNLQPATCDLQPATCKLTQTRQLGVRYALIVFVFFRLNTIALVLSVSCPKFHQSVLAVLDFSLSWNPNFPSNLKLAYGN